MFSCSLPPFCFTVCFPFSSFAPWFSCPFPCPLFCPLSPLHPSPHSFPCLSSSLGCAFLPFPPALSPLCPLLSSPPSFLPLSFFPLTSFPVPSSAPFIAPFSFPFSPPPPFPVPVSSLSLPPPSWPPGDNRERFWGAFGRSGPKQSPLHVAAGPPLAPPPRTARAWIPGADGTQVAAPGIFWGEVSPGSHKYRARPGGATSWRCRLGSLESSGSRGLRPVRGIPPPGLHGVRVLELRQCAGTRRTRGPVTSLLAILGMFLVKQTEKRTAPPWKLGFGFWESRPRALVPSSFPSRECVFSFIRGFLPCFCP